MSPPGGEIIVAADSVRDLVAAMFEAVGVSGEDAVVGADVLVSADLRGVASHGVNSTMLRLYFDWFEKGETDPTPAWRIVREAPSTANVDAGGGLGIFLAPRMMDLAIDKARNTGIGMVTLFGGRHLGMCAYHAMRALEHHMIGVCTTATGPLILPTNGAKPMIGTNPIAVAAPVGRGDLPFVFDAALSVIPGNKVLSARQSGSLLPPGVVADEEGRPIMEPSEAADKIRLLPLGSSPEMGSYKGYGLAMIVEILSGIIAGAGFGARHGFSMANHMLAAIDISSFIDVAEFEDLMADYTATLRETPAVPGRGPVMIPGEIETRAEMERRDTGIPLRVDTSEWLEEKATRLDVPFDLATP